MAGEVTVDALPYVDQGYDEPGVKEAAYALVEEETRRYRPTKNYLEHLPALDHTPFETEVLRGEFDRMAARLPMDMLSMKRYELPPPPAGRQNDVLAWNESVENSMAQLEHQSDRIANLELLGQYGSLAWKSHNELLVKMVDQSQKQLTTVRKNIQEINWGRKSSQVTAGDKLKNLEESWRGLVSKNYEIERACLEMEQEVERMKSEREAMKKKATEPDKNGDTKQGNDNREEESTSSSSSSSSSSSEDEEER